MDNRKESYKIKDADKGKKVSVNVDDAIKNDLNEHNLTKEFSSRLNPSKPAVKATFEISPELGQTEQLMDAYAKFAAELQYNRTTWYKLPEVSADGKTVHMNFETEKDLKAFQQRLKHRNLDISLQMTFISENEL